MFLGMKKRVIGFCIALLAVSVPVCAYQRCESIPQGVNRLLNHTSPAVDIGIVVQSMNTGTVYYSKNASEFFAPASVQKMFTVSSALLSLSPHYRFPTRLLTTGTISDGALHGNLIFQFSGDPSLNQSNMAEFIKKLKKMGVHRIDGGIMIDNTAYDHIPYPAGWSFDDLTTDFAAPLNTVIINRNRFGIAMIPAERAGEKATLIPHLPPGSATFYNETITTRYPKSGCPIKIYSNEHNQYMIRGCLARSQGTQRRAFAIRNMEMYSRALIRALLTKHQIHWTGGFSNAKTPVNAQVIDTHDSKPLGTLIIHLLKKSDNLYADSLLKKIGEAYHHVPGSWDNGVSALKPILSQFMGINPHALHFVDGAGLSEYNKVMPITVSELLYHIEHNDMLRDTLIPALPIAGVDGTLAGRMPMLARGRRLHAKTGSMGGVSTLAGFIKTNHHGLLSFVIMINKVPKQRGPYIVLENHLGEFLANAIPCNY